MVSGKVVHQIGTYRVPDEIGNEGILLYIRTRLHWWSFAVHPLFHQLRSHDVPHRPIQLAVTEALLQFVRQSRPDLVQPRQIVVMAVQQAHVILNRVTKWDVTNVV